jgi:hypothetical protein
LRLWYDDDVVAHYEVLVPAPLRIDLDQRCGTATNRTFVDTTMPTESAKLTLLTRGTLLPASTVC